MSAKDIKALHLEFNRIGWVKGEEVFAQYLAEAKTEHRWVRVAEWGTAIADM